MTGNPMEQAPSWQANIHSDNQEIPNLFYGAHKNPSLVRILSQMKLRFVISRFHSDENSHRGHLGCVAV
jgi:hypothetical protein